MSRSRQTTPSVWRRWFLRPLAALGVGTLGLLAAAGGIGCAISSPRYQGPKSEHFDGERFFNPGRAPSGSFGELLKWLGNRQRGPWRSYQEFAAGPPPPHQVDGAKLRVTYVGHATALIQQDGVNVLTDPIWSMRSSPVSSVGPKRVRPPGIRQEDLPPIQAVLISHNHYDHLDVSTLRQLKRAFPKVRFFSGLGNKAVLEKAGLEDATELDWWQEVQLSPGVTLTAVPVQHFSGRGLCDRDRTLWVGFVLKGPSGATYFGGDTGYGPHFAATRERLGPIRAALLPIGAYRPQWFMGPVHVSPEGAVQGAIDLAAQTSVPIHFGTFELADDGQDEAPVELQRALQLRGADGPRFEVLDFGEGRELP